MTDPYVLFEEARKQGPNPFKLKPIISADEVWGNVVTDLPNLNQHVDQTISQAISEVRKRYSDKIGIAIKGDRGTGKSHVIHRIWKTIEREGGAVFAYIPQFVDANRIESHVRFYLSQSFIHQDVSGATQWQQLAAAMIATLKGTEFEEKYQPYLEKCEDPEVLRQYILRNHSPAQRYELVDELHEAILENQSVVDHDFLKAVLLLLFKNAPPARVGMAWILGKEHPETKQRGLPEFSQQEQDARSIWVIQQICKLASVASRPVIICFDQLDQPNVNADCGDSAAQIVASCIDKIYFQCSNVIILCCVMSDRWREIEQMGSGIPDRVGQWSESTKPPTAEQMIELVKLRLDWFYSEKKLNPDVYPFLYPFDENEIKGIASKGAGVRSLMKWCTEKFDSVEIGGSVAPSLNAEEKKRKEFSDAYNELLERTSAPEQNDEQLAAIVTCAMKMLSEEAVENLVIEKVESIKAKSHDLHLTISGSNSTEQKNVKIGVRICETQTAATLTAAMKKLLDYGKYGITRGCLVRSTPLPKSWRKAKELEQQLVQQQGGEVVVLKKDEINPLAAIHTMYEEAENYGFTKEEISNFVKELKLAADNKLIREILSEGGTVT